MRRVESKANGGKTGGGMRGGGKKGRKESWQDGRRKGESGSMMGQEGKGCQEKLLVRGKSRMIKGGRHRKKIEEKLNERNAIKEGEERKGEK